MGKVGWLSISSRMLIVFIFIRIIVVVFGSGLLPKCTQLLCYYSKVERSQQFHKNHVQVNAWDLILLTHRDTHKWTEIRISSWLTEYHVGLRMTESRVWWSERQNSVTMKLISATHSVQTRYSIGLYCPCMYHACTQCFALINRVAFWCPLSSRTYK